MALDSGILSEFVKVTNDKTTTPSEATLYGTVVESDGRNMVCLDGSTELTPVYSTVVAKHGDRVTVMLKNHTATITGNLSDPSASGGKVTDLDNIVVSHSLSAEEISGFLAKFDTLKASIANIGELKAVYAEIETLEARFATIEHINSIDIAALEAQIDKIESKIIESEQISTDELNAAQAVINQLRAYNAEFTYVSAEVLTALKANISQLSTNKLDASFANIDSANINTAAVMDLYVRSGLIETAIMNEATVVKLASIVKLNADSIVAGTLRADRLLLQGEGGLYYQINLDKISGLSTMPEADREKYTQGLDGSAIIAESITTTQLAASVLTAFRAAIGGFEITDNAIYSGVKNSVDNPTTGLYMDQKGQFAVGDSDRYVKFKKVDPDDPDSETTLEIVADSLKFKTSSGTGEKTVEQVVTEAVENTEIGGRNLIEGSTNDWTNISVKKYGILDWSVNRTLTTRHSLQSLGLQAGDWVTFSADLNAINRPLGVTLTFIHEYINSKNETAFTTTDRNSSDTIPTDSFGRCSVTTQIPAGYEYISLRLYPTDSITSQTTEQYKAPKLEKGNMPTDWTPSPKDSEAGVRNYLLKSGPEMTLSDVSYDYNFSQDVEWFKSLAGTPATVSFDAKSNTDNEYRIDAMLLIGYPYNGKELSVNKSVKSISLTKEYKRYRYTFYCPTDITSKVQLAEATRAVYRIDGRASLNEEGFEEGDSFSIKNVKFELGTIATDWTVAPEEIEGDINSVRDETRVNNNLITSLVADNKGILAVVEAVENRLDDGLASVTGDLERLRQKVEVAVTADAVTAQVRSILTEDGSSKVVTTTGTFNDEGLTIAKDNSPLSTRVSEDGIEVVKDRGLDTKEQMLKADSHGVNAKNLHATTYLIVGTGDGRSRFEDYGRDGSARTGCFWIGG